MIWTDSVTLVRPSLRRSLMVGTAASAAYLAEQALDRRLTGNRYDDLVLWGGFLSDEPRRARAIGGTVHFALGTALAAAYLAVLPSLPRAPGWLRGILFAQIENLTLYPGVPLLDALHPWVRSGRLPRLTTWGFLWVETLRHLAYGVTLGVLEERTR